MNIIDLETLNQTGLENNLNLNYYSIAENPITGNLYAATADFVTNSQVYIYDSNNNEITNFESGVTTTKIVFDTRVEVVLVSESCQDNHRELIQVIDVFGRETNKYNNRLNIEIYNDGFIDKKYVITKKSIMLLKIINLNIIY